MNYCLIYFGVVLFILVAKFVQALFTIGKLKTFITNNKSVIEKAKLDEHDTSYISLFILHMGRFSYGKNYEESMLGDIKNCWSPVDFILVIMFALSWPLAVPVVLVCLLYNYCSKLLNNFLKNILDENGKCKQLS